MKIPAIGQKFLDRVERIGNRLPAPVTIFLLLTLTVLGLSYLLVSLGIAVTHPADQRVIAVENLLSEV